MVAFENKALTRIIVSGWFLRRTHQEKRGPSMSISVWWQNADGGEQEEMWDSIEQFRCWAQGEGISLSYRAYEEDEDGDYVPDR